MQTEIPSHFHNLWEIGGAPWEHEHARRLCMVLGHEQNSEGTDMVRVRFIQLRDLFDSWKALIHPHLLFPARP